MTDVTGVLERLKRRGVVVALTPLGVDVQAPYGVPPALAAYIRDHTEEIRSVLQFDSASPHDTHPQSLAESNSSETQVNKGGDCEDTSDSASAPPLFGQDSASPPDTPLELGRIESGRIWLDGRLDSPVDPAVLAADTPLFVDVETAPGPRSKKRKKGVPVPWHPGASLYCVGFAALGAKWAFPADARQEIQAYLATPVPKVFHNSAYDVLWLLASGFAIEGPVDDTLWLRALAEGGRAAGLKEIGHYEYEQHLPGSTSSPVQILGYCANDCLNTSGVFSDPRYQEWRSHRLYHLYKRMAIPVARMALHGLPLIQERVESLYVKTTQERTAALDRLQMYYAIDWRSPAQIRAVLADYLPGWRKTKTGKLSTSEAALLECDHLAASVLLEFRRLDKRITTYLETYRHAATVHGMFQLNGAATGRLSCSTTNLQNVPREKDVRSLFGSPEFEWVKLDFSGAELVVAARIAQCTQMLEWFANGRDAHVEVAALMLCKAVADVTLEDRQKIKAVNFGLLYGGTWRTLQQKLWQEHKIAVKREEAKSLVEAWFALFPEFTLWQERVKRQARAGETRLSPFGRRWTSKVRTDSWYLEQHDLNTALNASVQGTASDLLLLGLERVWERIPGHVVLLLHDELDVLISKGTWNEAQWREIARMIVGVDRRFPMKLEVKRGLTWGEAVTQFTVGGE